MFVYLFKNFHCVLSYHSSSLGRGNINGYKWTVISFNIRIFIKTKCQVSLVVQYIFTIRNSVQTSWPLRLRFRPNTNRKLKVNTMYILNQTSTLPVTLS